MRSPVCYWLERIDIEVDESEDGGCFNYDLRGECYRAIGKEDLANADDTSAKECRNERAESERRSQRFWGV